MGPDLALRYLTGIYPMALVARAWIIGMLVASVANRAGTARALGAVAALGVSVCLAAPWVGPGAQDLLQVIDSSRWGPSLRYNPGIWLSRAGLRALPPVPLWDQAVEFLEYRRTTGADRDFEGFDLLFRPENDLSTQGWQPYPPITATRIAELVASEAPPPGLAAPQADQRLQNLGWAIAMVGNWKPDVVVSLLQSAAGAPGWESVVEGIGEGLVVTERDRGPWSGALGQGAGAEALGRGWARGRARLSEAQ
ncbi:MAG TPA: hypothetical protein DIU15_07650 [Deltaproteobacteria bacterium]|nr:hypothetical protein [Deltaproteobacteria bacterium]